MGRLFRNWEISMATACPIYLAGVIEGVYYYYCMVCADCSYLMATSNRVHTTQPTCCNNNPPCQDPITIPVPMNADGGNASALLTSGGKLTRYERHKLKDVPLQKKYAATKGEPFAEPDADKHFIPADLSVHVQYDEIARLGFGGRDRFFRVFEVSAGGRPPICFGVEVANAGTAQPRPAEWEELPGPNDYVGVVAIQDGIERREFTVELHKRKNEGP
jgi:hypothetical protein